jgi:CPA2 family monovalent cation:H+ antiporter-2
MIDTPHSPLLCEIACHAQDCPDKIALVDGECRISYARLMTNIETAAHRLQSMGLKAGDRIILAGSDTDVAAFQKMLETSLAATTDTNNINTSIVLDNYTIAADSPLCGKSILKSGIREQGNCIVMGLVRPAEDFYTNPDPNIIICEDDIIIVAGEKQKMQEFFNGE